MIPFLRKPEGALAGAFRLTVHLPNALPFAYVHQSDPDRINVVFRPQHEVQAVVTPQQVLLQRGQFFLLPFP
jgi:hypothetical protein